MSAVSRPTDHLPTPAFRRQAGRVTTMALVGLTILSVIALDFAIDRLWSNTSTEVDIPSGNSAVHAASAPGQPASYGTHTEHGTDTSTGQPSAASPTEITPRAPAPTDVLAEREDAAVRNLNDSADEWRKAAAPAGSGAEASDREDRFDSRPSPVDRRSAGSTSLARAGNNATVGDSSGSAGPDPAQTDPTSDPTQSSNSRVHETRAEKIERSRNLLNLRRKTLGLPPVEAIGEDDASG